MSKDKFKEIEYVEAHNLLRFHLELRSKTFNFGIIMNGLLFTIIFSHLDHSLQRIALAVFGVATCIILLALTNRTMYLADMYGSYITKLEEEMNLRLITETSSIHHQTRKKARSYFQFMFYLLLALWGVVIFLTILNPS